MQRYEYVLMRGWVNAKTVADLGAGTCAGSLALSAVAKIVYVVDINDFVTKARELWVPVMVNSYPSRMVTLQQDVFDFVGKVDVAIAVELFEHMAAPQKLIDHMATICKNLFITTPLAMLTSETRNKNHYREYSVEDFESIVGTKFNILERKYQMSDLSVADKPEFGGDSIDLCHTVQMLWCEVR